MLRVIILFSLLTGIFILGHSHQSIAGNKWMMEKNADELIMLNSLLLKRLGTIQKDGKIILSGDVIHEDGKVIIKLHELQQIDSTSDKNIFSPETFDKDLPYKIFLREETLTEIPMDAQEKVK